MLQVYEVTRELIVSLRVPHAAIKRCDAELADQLCRAANSVLLNLGEAQKFLDGNRRKHYALAQGSANEVKAALDAAAAWGWLEDASEPRALLDRVLAMLWRLTQSPVIAQLGGANDRACREDPVSSQSCVHCTCTWHVHAHDPRIRSRPAYGCASRPADGSGPGLGRLRSRSRPS